MKKDFSQPFNKLPNAIWVIVQDDETKKFALWRGDEDYYDEGFDEVFTFKANDEYVALKAAEYLCQAGFDLEEHNELARETQTDYSFVDETPGETSDSICILATVKVLSRPDKSRHIEWLGLGEFVKRMKSSHSLTKCVADGLVKLELQGN